MNERIEIMPNVYLRAMQSDKFKTGCFSINFLRQLRIEEAAMNALIPSVLLRGSEKYPDMAAISNRSDDLYGATIGALARKKGEVQMIGLYADFLEDCFVPEPVFEPVLELLEDVLFCPKLENGVFGADAFEGERINLIRTIESNMNDKRSYVITKLMQTMCKDEAYSVPRLGRVEDLENVTPETLYAQYQKLLATSQVEIFYMGRQPQNVIVDACRAMLTKLPRESVVSVGTVRVDCAEAVREDSIAMDVTQGKMALGLRTATICSDADYPAMMLMNVIFGGGVTSKLFENVREKRSLCYYVGSSLEKFKGVMVVSSGVDFAQFETAKAAILKELDDCRQGIISETEIENARKMVLSSLRAIQDAPTALDDFYIGMAIADQLDLPEMAQAIEKLTVADVSAAAQKLTLDTVYYLTGVTE